MRLFRALLFTLVLIPLFGIIMLIPFVNYFALIQLMELLWHQVIVARTAKIENLVATQNVRNTRNG